MTALRNDYTGPPGYNGGQGSAGNPSNWNGGSGGNGGPGGYALSIAHSGTFTSYGHILGGSGGAGGTGGSGYGRAGVGGTGGTGGSGGAGVYLSSGSLTNRGEITGGTGGAGGVGGGAPNGAYGGAGGAGGLGVDLSSGSLTNRHEITGGAGGAGGRGNSDDTAYGGAGGAGGTGVLSSGSLSNIAGTTIIGGAGGTGGNGGGNSSDDYSYGGDGGTGGAGGDGVDLVSGTLTNGGKITGGVGGAGGAGGAGGFETNDNGRGGYGGAGGAGVFLQGGTLTNNSLIIGGDGGNGGGSADAGGDGGAGGAGVYQSSGTVTNRGHITGGNGGNGGSGSRYGYGGVGGAGVELRSGSFTGTGTISGGNGGVGATGYSGNGGAGGSGGAGVELRSGSFTGTGTITGGSGGTGGTGLGGSGTSAGAGGIGGTGIELLAGSFTNTGTIAGGNGGAGGSSFLGAGSTEGSGGSGGSGGAGAYLDGGTLTTSGTISGGGGGSAGNGIPGGSAGASGDAVQFGSVASTLVVKPGAVFNGQVGANASVNDVLKLSGIQAGGTPITLGTQFTSFSTLTFVSAAAWTVDASTGAAPSSGLTIDGFTGSDTIDVTNLTPTQVAADFDPATHMLTTADDGTLHFNSSFNGEYFVFSNDGGTGTDITLATGSGISTTLTSTVTLGGSAHPSPLIITNTGIVAPTAFGAIGLVSNHAANTLTNNGTIQGGVGSHGVGGNGGVGVDFKLGATLTDNGTITGGAGGLSLGGTPGGAGAAGVNLLAGTLTLTSSGSIAGGQGGSNFAQLHRGDGGAGGTGVFLNGGTLITAGIISGGAGGSGALNGAAGDAVKFGAAASTLVVEPGAVFNGQVVANASAHDVLELAGTQSGGTPITLGTQFTNFSTLKFAPGATGTVDATKSDLTSHPLTIDGFGTSDTLDITNFAAAGATASFNASTEILAITKGTTTIDLKFDSAFSGKHFVLGSDGHSGTDVHLQSGAGTIAASAHDFMNFVGEEHHALMGSQSMPMFGSYSAGSALAIQTDPSLAALGTHGFSAHAFADHGLAHASLMLR